MAETLDPLRNALNAPFWSAGDEGRLLLPVCIATGRAYWPPSPVSPFVTGGAVAWRDAEPIGTLLSVVVYRRGFQKAFESLMPYGVGLIQLDAGPRLLAHVSNPGDPGAPRAGQRAALAFACLVEGGPRVPIVAQPPAAGKTERAFAASSST